MFQLYTHWIAFKQSLVAVCTALSPSENPSMFVEEVCYNSRGCCADEAETLSGAIATTPDSIQADVKSA